MGDLKRFVLGRNTLLTRAIVKLVPTLDSDDLFVLNAFESIREAFEFATNFYSALTSNFVSAGMIQEEYKDHLNIR